MHKVPAAWGVGSKQNEKGLLAQRRGGGVGVLALTTHTPLIKGVEVRPLN